MGPPGVWQSLRTPSTGAKVRRACKYLKYMQLHVAPSQIFA
jgi:hypothetical protein